jgi:hypothetical protein
MTDWAKGLVQLGLAAEDWGPVTGEDYAQLKKYWRGTTPLPSEPDLLAAIAAAPSPPTPKPLPPVLPTPSGGSLPALRDEVAALTAVVNDLRDILESRGIAT